VALIAAGVLLLGGVAFAGVALVDRMSTPPDALAGMAPATDQAYVTAFLDPGADQALNLRDLLERFPALQGKDPGKSLDEMLESALRPSGLSWVEDVKPWVGSQIAVTGKVDQKTGFPDIAVLIASDDDAKALDTLKRVERLSDNANLRWTSETYKGIEIRVGRGAPGGPEPGDPISGLGQRVGYAIVDHTVVVATSPDRVEAVIDADQGDGDSLADDETFQQARDALPDDMLGMAYVNAGGLLDQVIPTLEAGVGFSELPAGCAGDDLNQSLDALRAFRGVGVSLTAETDGVALDAGVALDTSKLPSGGPVDPSSAHESSVLSFMPKDAYALITLSGADAFRQQVEQIEKCAPDARDQLEEYGVKDILANLSGDMGITVGPGRSTDAPVAALVAAVKDEANMKTSLERLASKLAEDADVKPTSETYQGVSIESLPVDEGDEGILPSWAVTDGVAIVASNPDAVKAAIDAHAGEDVTDSPTFQQAAAKVDLENSGMLYVDVRAALDAVETTMSGSALEDFQRFTENVRPVKATIIEGSSDGDVLSLRWFFLVP
jgi:hypothetical protein